MACLDTFRSVRLGVLGIALVGLWVTATWGDGMYRDGVGAISTGRGGTNIGFSDNAEVMLDNPAGMVNMPNLGLIEVGVDTLFADLQYGDADNRNVTASRNPFPMGQLAVIRKSLDGNVAVGLGFFSQAGFAATYDMNGPFPIAGTQRYKSFGAMARILPGVSVKLTDRCSAGATFGVAVGHAELEGPYFIQGPSPFVGTPTRLDLQGTGAGYSWSLGMQYLLGPRTTFGVSFQAESSIQLNGSTRLTIPGLGTSSFDSRLETEWPATLGLGVKHRLSPLQTIAFDVIWTAWSEALDTYDLTLTDPSNPAFAAVIGSSLFEQFPLNWRDSVAIRVGLERQLSRGQTFRTGYVYHPNPIPSSTFTPYIQTNVEHAYSIGYGRQYGPCDLNLAYQYTWGPNQTVDRSDFVGGDFDDSRASVNAHWLLLSLLRRF